MPHQLTAAAISMLSKRSGIPAALPLHRDEARAQ